MPGTGAEPALHAMLQCDLFVTDTAGCVYVKGPSNLLRQFVPVQGLCESWPGPLSIAFYLAVVANGSLAAEEIAATVAAVNATFHK